MTTWRKSAEVYLEPRVVAVLVLGFSSGLPLLLVYSTLSARLQEAGVSLTAIGLFSWASTAYAIKFLWSPLVDRLPIPWLTRRLGRRRSWLVLSQLAVAAAMLGLGSTDPAQDLVPVAAWAVALAFASATQDIAIDAFRIEILDERRQGAGAANIVLGYRLGMLAAGAGALIVADSYGWFWAYAAMAALMTAGLAAALATPEPKHLRPATSGPTNAGAWLGRAVIAPFADFATRPGWIAILAFVLLYKYGDALLGVMANPFYLALGFSLTEIGVVSKGYGLAMTLIGGLAGGLLVARRGILPALLICGILQAISNVVFAVQAMIGYSLPMLSLTIAVENLTGGAATAAFVAYLSSLCAPTHAATQYALLSSFAAAARTLLASGGGWLAEQLGWIAFFLVTTVAAVPGLLLLLWLMRRAARPEAVR